MDGRHGQQADIEGIPEDPDDEHVAQRVRQAGDPQSVKAAIRELGRRRSGLRTELLTDVVLDGEQDADVRALAAVELGKQADTAHRQALLRALKVRERPVVRRAAEALGRIGDEEAYARLGRLRPRDPVVSQSVRFARTLISYRLGLDRDLLDAPRAPRLPESQRGEPMDIDFATPSEPVAREALTAAEEEFPALRLSTDGALDFSCGGDRFFVAFNRDVHRRKTLRGLRQHNAILMTVMRRPEVLGRYGAYMYVLTHPDSEDRLRLFAVRTTGLIALTGEVTVQERHATFRVDAQPSAHQVPVTVEAAYDHDERRIRFVTTNIAADFLPGQKGSRQPAKSPPPAR